MIRIACCHQVSLLTDVSWFVEGKIEMRKSDANLGSFQVCCELCCVRLSVTWSCGTWNSFSRGNAVSGNKFPESVTLSPLQKCNSTSIIRIVV